MEIFAKKKSVHEDTNFNRSPLRSQSQCSNKKKSSRSESRDSTLTRSQTFTTGLPVYSIENDPLGTVVAAPLSQASSGYLSINGEVTSPSASNISLYEQKSDYGGSTSEVSGISSVDSETLNVIYASRYQIRRKSEVVEIPVNIDADVPFHKGRSSSESKGRRESSRSSSRGHSVSRHDSMRSSGSSRSDGTYRSDSIRSSRSSRSVDSGHSSRIRSPDSMRSYRSSSSSNSTGSSSSSRVSRVRYGDSGRSRHSKIVEEDPYFTKGVCSSFREDASAEVRVRGSPDYEEFENKSKVRQSRSGSFRRSKPCMSMVRDRDTTQSLENLDKIDGETTLDRKSRRDARSVGNLVQVPVPNVPSHYEPSNNNTLRRNAKSVGNLVDSGRDNTLESSFSTGNLLEESNSDAKTGNKKDPFFKRGIFKFFRKNSSDKTKEKSKKDKKVPKSKSVDTDLSRRGSCDTLTNESRTDTIKSQISLPTSREGSLTSRENTLTRDNVNYERGLRESRDFDRNDSLERAIRSSNDQSGTLTRENCNDRRSRDLTDERRSRDLTTEDRRSRELTDMEQKVGALNAILRQTKSPSVVKKRAPPPVPPHRSSRSKSTYQILDEIKAQNAARNIESMPIPDDPPTPESPLPASPLIPASGTLKRTGQSRDSRSLGAMANKSETLRRHNSRNDIDDTYDFPPPPEDFIQQEAIRPQHLPLSDKQPKGILKNKTPSDDMCSPRELKNALNEPFYARNQQRRNRPSCPPPVPPHATHKSDDQLGNQLRNVQLRPTAGGKAPPVPAHQNFDIKSQLKSVNLRKQSEPKPQQSELESVLQSSLKRRSQGTVLENDINDEIKNVVLRRTQPSKPPKGPEIQSQIHNVVLRKTQNTKSLRNSIVMDPAALVHAQSQPAAVVHQAHPKTVHLISQPRPHTSVVNRSLERNSIFDALNEHSDTLRKMAKPQLPRKPSFNDSFSRDDQRREKKESVYGILDNYMESRKSLDSQKSLDSESCDSLDTVDFPPPPPPICDYNIVVDC